MDAIIDFFSKLTLSQLTLDATLLIAGLATVIQITPIKINPWSSLAKAIGRAINKEVIDKVDKLEKDVKNLNDRADERGAKAARARILRFGDEIMHGVRHSKEHFDDILGDITEYNHYCEIHKDFENDRTGLTSKHIKETYRKCLEDHNFI